MVLRSEAARRAAEIEEELKAVLASVNARGPAEALKALATSVAMNGPSQAKSYLEQLYKAKNNGSLDGLDKMISEAASGLK